MEIHWPTVGAQIVNFLILVYLLKRFLYGPITRAMDRREQGIADRIQKAEDQEREADKEAQAFRRKTDELEAQREALLGQAKDEAEVQRKVLIDQVRGEIDETRRRWQEEVKRERDVFLGDVRNQLAHLFFLVASRAMRDLGDARIEERIIDRFLEQLGGLRLDEKAHLTEAARSTGNLVRINSSFEIPEPLQKRLIDLVHKELAPELEIHFEQSPDLICGVKLMVPGLTVDWNLQSYMSDLETRLATVLTEPSAETAHSYRLA